jgi:cell division protein FtsB
LLTESAQVCEEIHEDKTMRRFDFVVTCVCCALLGYFAWHAFKGPRGFPYQASLNQKMAILEKKFESVRQVRVRLERKVTLLRPESIDPDILDEMARSSLELARPGDVVAFTGR